MTRLHNILSVLLVCASLMLIPDAAVQGQSSVARSDHVVGAIDGSVRDTSGSWLHGVEVVSVDNSLIRTRSGAGGSFRLDSLTPGPHLIRFRRIGIMPLTVSVVVDSNATTSVDAVLEPFPITLSRVTVQAVSGELVHLQPGVADRMRTGIGTYLTAAQIDQFHVTDAPDIFRHVPGLSVEKNAAGPVVRSARGIQTIHGNPCPTGMVVVLDGAETGSALAATSSALSLDGVSPSDIAAIEIYKDGAETPASLVNSECGVIYVWTK